MVFQNSQVWHKVCNHRSRKSRCLQRVNVTLNMTLKSQQTSYAEIIIWRISYRLGARRWRRWRPETKSMWKSLPLNQKYYVYSSSTLGCLRFAPLQSSFLLHCNNLANFTTLDFNIFFICCVLLFCLHTVFWLRWPHQSTAALSSLNSIKHEHIWLHLALDADRRQMQFKANCILYKSEIAALSTHSNIIELSISTGLCCSNGSGVSARSHILI